MLEGWTRRGNRDEDRRNSALPNQSPKCSAGLAMDSMSRTSAALCPFFKVPSLPKPEVDSSLAEKPFLRPSLARGGLRFPVSARRHRLQAPFGAPVSEGKNPVPNSNWAGLHGKFVNAVQQTQLGQRADPKRDPQSHPRPSINSATRRPNDPHTPPRSPACVRAARISPAERRCGHADPRGRLRGMWTLAPGRALGASPDH